MKNFIVGLLFVFIVIDISAQDLITSEVTTKVYFLKIGKKTGSCFLINHDGKKFLITAKHLLGEVNSKQKLFFELRKDSVWMKMEGIILLNDNPKIDIAVIDLNSKTKVKNHVGLTIKGLVYSDEGYFLGFPYGLIMENSESQNDGFPVPLVKKAIMSAFFYKDSITTLFLDGHNNPGFSGGPIVFKNRDKKQNQKWNIIGVISAYKGQKNELITPFGKLKYQENSGIIVGYGINHAIEIIEKNK